MASLASSPLLRLQMPALLSPARWSFLGRQSVIPKWLPALAAATPGVSLNIPSLLEDIWEGILRAVPKNKVSHSRKRHRQMAGKALKDVNHLVKCPGCGAPKRMHRLCSHCLEGMFGKWQPSGDIRTDQFVAEMKTLWKQDSVGEKPFGP
jgi:ribosomal protein L32